MKRRLLLSALCVILVLPNAANANSPQGSALLGMVASVGLTAMGLAGIAAKVVDTVRHEPAPPEAGNPVTWVWNHDLVYYPACGLVTLGGVLMTKMLWPQLRAAD